MRFFAAIGERRTLMSAFVIRIALFILAFLLIIVGLIVLPLPLPFGALMIIVGVTILISSNETAAGWVRNRRSQNPKLNGRLLVLEARLPGILGRILRRTTP